MTLPQPVVDAESAPFYAAAEEGRFLIRECTACGEPHWYPRALCPFCFAPTVWKEASGAGTIYSFSVMRKASPVYVIAYVTLAEGPTMLTNIVDCEPEDVAIGQPVELRWKVAGENLVACFTPRS